jgi:predicted HNH restriction endonuclease
MSGTDGISARIRRYMLEKYEYKCQNCKCDWKNPYTDLTILQIHHINGDSSDNSESNLQVLCPNCHAMTENFGFRNKNSSRIYRKQYRNS